MKCTESSLNNFKLTVLGSEWTIILTKDVGNILGMEADDEWDGLTSKATHQIIIRPSIVDDCVMNKKGAQTYLAQTLRHEILHAYLFESGLDWSSRDIESWATNEEMIDWIALQFPKILDTYRIFGIESRV